jgi:hypothetical protein
MMFPSSFQFSSFSFLGPLHTHTHTHNFSSSFSFFLLCSPPPFSSPLSVLPPHGRVGTNSSPWRRDFSTFPPLIRPLQVFTEVVSPPRVCLSGLLRPSLSSSPLCYSSLLAGLLSVSSLLRCVCCFRCSIASDGGSTNILPHHLLPCQLSFSPQEEVP